MNIDLNRIEVTNILKEKFGDATFRVLYTESDRLWEDRNNRKITDMVEPPNKESYVLYFDNND